MDENNRRRCVKKVYGGDGVNILPAAKKQIDKPGRHSGFGGCPVCIAKNAVQLLGRSRKARRTYGFHRHGQKRQESSAGAGFVIVLTGDIMTMPGLPKIPCRRKV